MATGFTPQNFPSEQTPSTDKVIQAVEEAGFMYRRAAATSPERAVQMRLRKLGAGKEELAERRKGMKKDGRAVFGKDADASAEKKICIQQADISREEARREVHEDFRPPPFARPRVFKPPPAIPVLCVMPTTIAEENPMPQFRVPSIGDTPDKQLPRTPTTASVGTKVPVEVINPVSIDPVALAALRQKKDRLLASPTASETSSRRAKLEEIRIAKLEAERKVYELAELERAYATTAKSSTSGTGSTNALQPVPNFPIFTPTTRLLGGGPDPLIESYKSLSSVTGIALPSGFGVQLPQFVPRNLSQVSESTFLHEQRLQAALAAANPTAVVDEEEAIFLAAFKSQWEEIQARKAAASSKAPSGQMPPPLPAPAFQPPAQESRGRPSNRGIPNLGGKTGTGGSPPSSSSSSDSSSTSSMPSLHSYSSAEKEDRGRDGGGKIKKDKKDKKDRRIRRIRRVLRKLRSESLAPRPHRASAGAMIR